MALNTGGFTLGVMPEAPRGVENLGRFDVGQVLAASRAGADNVEQAFNTPFRVQQEIAKTKAAQAASKIAQAKAARAAEAVDVELAEVKESAKAQELANRLKQETFDANANLAKIRAEQAATDLAASKEENPLKQRVLQAQAEHLGVAAEAAQLDLEASKQAGVFAEQAKSKASTAKLLAGESELGLETLPIRQKALREFGDTGIRQIGIGKSQVMDPSGAIRDVVDPLAAASAQPGGGLAPVINPVTGKQALDANGNPLFQRPEVVGKSFRMSKPFAIGASESEVSEDSPFSQLKDYVLPYSTEQAARNAEKVSDAKTVADLNKRKASLQRLRADAEKFVELNAKEDTGPVQGTVQRALALIGTSDETKQMASLSDTMNAFCEALKGQGPVTENEREMLRRALPSIDKDRTSNKAFLDQVRQMEKHTNAKSAFFNKWRQSGMGQLAGAEQVWSDYVNEVPDLSTPIEKWIETRNIKQGEPQPIGVQTAQAKVKTGPTKAPRVIQKGVTFVLQPDGVTYLPE